METQLVIKALEREWDFETGFFGRLRKGDFDRVSFNRLVSALDAIDLGADKCVDRRLVSLVWYMPIFMSWQFDRVKESNGDLGEFDQATNRVQCIVEKVLGVP